MVAGMWVSEQLFSSCVGASSGVSTISVMFSVYPNLLFDVGKMFDRSKDRPALIIFSTVVEIP